MISRSQVVTAWLLVAGLSMASAQQPRSDSPASGPGDPAQTAPKADPASPFVLGHTMKRIDGKEEDLSQYKGKVLVIVNVASKCGYTPQYGALEKLYEAKKGQGLVILGFPANDFGKQEPGTNAEIASFCSDKFGVTFPMFEKIAVKGPDQHPLYRQLAAQPEPIGGDPKWNFTKFVVDRSGKVVARFDAKSRQGLEPDLLAKIDELLGDSGAPPKTDAPAVKHDS